LKNKINKKPKRIQSKEKKLEDGFFLKKLFDMVIKPVNLQTSRSNFLPNPSLELTRMRVDSK
jgi:hypothetical protein